MYADATPSTPTVTPRVFAQNLLVMGSLPPVLPAVAVDEARAAYGAGFTADLVTVLKEFGIRVDA